MEVRRRAKFGTKSAAYRKAGLNAATWDRVELGESVRDDRLAAAIQLLWPESGGDWRRVLADMDERMANLSKSRYPLFSGSWDDPDYLGSVEEWIEELQGRIEVLEAAVFKGDDDDAQRNAAPNKHAGGSPAEEPRKPRVGRGPARDARASQSGTRPRLAATPDDL